MKTWCKILLIAGLVILCSVASAGPVASTATVAPRNVDISYPLVEGLGPADALINATLNREIDGFAEIFRRPEMSGKVSYEVQLNKANLLSVTISEMHYARRAAHPMTYLRGYTFDARNGEVLALADLFKPDADYRGRLNTIMAAQIAGRKIPIFSFTPFSGVKESQEYYLTADSLVVYYQLYEFTPYVFGFLRFTIPYRDIGDILKPELELTIL